MRRTGKFLAVALLLALLTPLMVWLIRRIHPADAHHRVGWYLLVYLAFATHVLLDSSTIYGTQIFWPLDNTPMTWGSIFIIDPLFTLPLFIGLTGVILARRNPLRGYWINAVMLSLSTLYLAWSFGAKFHAQGVARETLAEQGISVPTSPRAPTTSQAKTPRLAAALTPMNDPGICICPTCGTRVVRQPGALCSQMRCPNCSTQMMNAIFIGGSRTPVDRQALGATGGPQMGVQAVAQGPNTGQSATTPPCPAAGGVPCPGAGGSGG